MWAYICLFEHFKAAYTATIAFSLCIMDVMDPIGCSEGETSETMVWIIVWELRQKVRWRKLYPGHRRRVRFYRAENLQIDFQRHDARHLPSRQAFDLAIMFCEGHSPLNGLFPLFHSVKDSHADTTDAGVAAYDGSTFDLMTFRDYNIDSTAITHV